MFVISYRTDKTFFILTTSVIFIIASIISLFGIVGMLFSSDLAVSMYLGLVTVILLISIYLYEVDKNYVTNKRLQIMLVIICIIFVSVAIVDVSTSVEQEIKLNDTIEQDTDYNIGNVHLTRSYLPMEYRVSEEYGLCIINPDVEDSEEVDRFIDDNDNIKLSVMITSKGNDLLINERTDDILIREVRNVEERGDLFNIDGVPLEKKDTCESDSDETKAILYKV